jgi:hypothetical protein
MLDDISAVHQTSTGSRAIRLPARTSMTRREIGAEAALVIPKFGFCILNFLLLLFGIWVLRFEI